MTIPKISFVFALLLTSYTLKQPQSPEQLLPPKNFEITSFKNQSFKLTNDGYDHPYRCLYKANLKVKNLTDKTIDHFKLKINYRSYNKSGESYLFFNDLYDISFGKMETWSPESEKTFAVKEYIYYNDIVYPTNRIEVVFAIYASDPFDVIFNEEIASYDITTEWLKF